jgi:dihydrofolate synthase/folylpolyglutamate synthase
VVCCTAPSPRGLPGSEVAAAATAIGCDDVAVAETVERACDIALADASSDDAILVTGSLYVVGNARPHLIKVLP